MLRGPDCPGEVLYLREWLYQLYGRSGAGSMGDVAPLSWKEIEAWSNFTGIRPTPDEVDALMLLDAALRAASLANRPKQQNAGNADDAPSRRARGR